MYEVELKFPVADPPALWAALVARGAKFAPPVEQSDEYFAHPARDFSVTDEALRLRSVADRHELTYKGPVIDRFTKTRRELETRLADGPATVAALHETLIELGFRPVRRVDKTRRTAMLAGQSRSITCAWDDVPPLGTFVEFELLADDAGRAAAAADILALAKSLGLHQSEGRSYLELLLAHDAGAERC